MAIAALGALAATAPNRRTTAAPLRVTATTTTIASLVRAVGGDDVVVTLLDEQASRPGKAGVKAPGAAAVAHSQLLVWNGDREEAAWLTPLLGAAPNGAIRDGGRGRLDASRVGFPAECPPLDLLDPVRGLALADAIRAKLEALRPARRRAFTEAYEAFRARLATAMLGDRLGTKYPIEKVADLQRLGTLDTFLAGQHESALLGGWFARLQGTRGAKAAADRQGWGCFARRFGIQVVAVWGGEGGDRPLDEKMRGVRLLLAGFGGDSARLRAAAKRSHVPIAELTSQVRAAPGTDDYLDLIDYDVRAMERALGQGRR